MTTMFTVIALIGFPGSGKTTLRNRFAEQGYPTCHVGEFIRSHPANSLREKWEAYRVKGEPVPEMAETFLGELHRKARNGVVVSDAFPRRIEEAQALVNDPRVNLVAVRLRLPGKEVETSFRRQTTRALRKVGVQVDADHFARKILATQQRSLEAWRFLEEEGVPIFEVDATKPPHQVWQEVRDLLQLGPRLSNFEIEAFRSVADVSERSGIEAWLAGDSVSYGFWGGRFGPPRYPTVHEVLVASDSDAGSFQELLETFYPARSWSVRPLTAVGAALSEVCQSQGLIWNVDSYLKFHPLRWKRVVAQWKDEGLCLRFGPFAEGDLRFGKLVYELQSSDGDGEGEYLLEPPSDELVKIKSLFPGLEGGFDYSWFSFPQLRKIRTSQEGTARGVFISLSERQLRLAQELSRITSKVEEGIPQPLPFLADGCGEGPVPESILNFLGEASDEVFHSYLVHEADSCVQGECSSREVESLLSLSFLEECKLRRYDRIPGAEQRQSITHLGLGVGRHHLDAALLLRLDHLEGLSFDQKVGIRVGMLVHDLGKLYVLNPYCPGAHTALGRRLWERYAPSWLSDTQKESAGWVIAHHDLLGRLSRTLVEKVGSSFVEQDGGLYSAYKGAIHPEQVIQIAMSLSGDPKLGLDVLSAVYRADVGSIATLRNFVELIPHLQKILSV